MGRKLMRVPLDFKYPQNQIWVGYKNPYNSLQCEPCDGKGHSPEVNRLNDEWYGFHLNVRYGAWCYNLDQDDVDALIKNDRLWDFTRVPINKEQEEIVRKKLTSGENSWLPFHNGKKITAAEVNEWSRQRGNSHDGINRWICVKAKAERLGLKLECEWCNGTGQWWISEEIKKLHEEFNPIDPPAGEGYQLWETTSEGSPITPVFKTLDELCEYAEKNCTTFGSHKTTAENWKEMLEKDFVSHEQGKISFI